MRRRGSALLIVLGMISFLVVSAVAFSAYMRYSRMPSSYLRRTSSSRLLVKAALAEAIEAVDAAIGNNPYPGVGESPARGQMKNVWRNRVFVGTTGSAGTGSIVSTLSMEGLAYLPPAFINEVRYQSRRTPTATWQTLNYDAGRFAYCAVDVSDCLDVNRIIADAGRDSSDEGRITLSYCFENPAHTGYTIRPSTWDSFMEKFSNPDGKGSKIPLVSVADLNLAMAANGGFDEMSPFCKYLKQSNNAKMVEDDQDGKPAVELQRNLAFVTDSYFVRSNVTDTSIIDLSRERDQPFYGMRMMKNDNLTKNDDTPDQIFENLSGRPFARYLDFPRLVQLYDYLDGDSVPISLAMPTVERVPMVTTVGFNGDMIVSVAKKTSEPIMTGKDPAGNPSGYVRVTVGELKLAGELGVKVGCAYPFKYMHGSKPAFKAQAAATITLVPYDSADQLRRSAAVAPAVYTRGDWTTSKKSPTAARYGNEKTPVVITMQSEMKSITVNDVKEEEDAVCTDLSFNFGTMNVSLSSEFENGAIPQGVNLDDNYKKGTFRLVERLDGKMQPAGEAFETTLQPSTAKLDGVEEMKDAHYVPVVQVWVRVVDANDNIVDLVPACFHDDEKKSEVLAEFRSSRERPVLRFSGSNTDELKLHNDKDVLNYGDKKITFFPKVYVADDPRFNHAPECFWAKENLDGDFKNIWLNAQRSKSRDGDVFMTTSDAGYLQSVFELSALLDVERADLNHGTFNGSMRKGADSLASGDRMWTTWSQCKLGDGAGGDITREVRFVNNGRGFRVNPFTDDISVMMAALANTPLDWWSAGTNDLCAASGEKNKMLNSLEEANKYTFSKHSGAKVQVEYGTRRNPQNSLTELARNFMSAFRNGGSDWQNTFDNKIDWNAEDKIAGVDLGVTLHSVDKKFLHGFWRECFANRQHLFLIFVRAEPMMMGGGSLGQTPPQLGARAVALVWRDPTPNVRYPNGPHRTRVLFYRQFD